MSEDANENSDYYNPLFTDLGNESGNTSVAKQSASKQKQETATVLPGSCFVRVGCIFHYCQQRLDVQCEISRIN